MAKQVNFEVQVMQGGRWTIHARYPGTAQEDAVEDAKQIAASKVGEVRVLRDVYDASSGTSNERTVYKSKGPSQSGGDDSRDTGGGSSSDSGGGGDDDDDDDDDDEDSFTDIYDEDAVKEKKRQKKEKKRREKEAARKGGPQTSITGFIVKFLLVVLMAIGVAGTSVGVAVTFLDGVNLFGVRLHGVAMENAMIYLFLFMFFGTTIMLWRVLIGNARLKAKKQKAPPPRRQQARPQASTAQAKAKAQAQSAHSQRSHGHLEDSKDTLTFKKRDDEGQQTESDADKAQAMADAAAQALADADANAAHEAAFEAAAEEEAEATPEEKDPNDDNSGAGGLSPHEEKQKTYMMQFISSAMAGMPQDNKAMSNFDKFGVSLFLAGAVETMSQKSEVSDEAKARIMADAVQTMGFKRSHASSFSQKYDEYLVQDPTYMQMFQAGRNSMNTYLTDETRIGKNMDTAMTEWNKPKVKEEHAGPITVLFTDIAGSTAMTQDLGDAGAQEVVRAHNRVVREALTMWNGKEVKHTGDGIMASFVKTSDSLDAAMQMQRESAQHTEQTPTRPLFLKIGINSGEPIAEDNDLFGTTVQMSARIVDKALKEEIFVSEIVRGICAGKSYKFKNRGSYPMKGFEVDPILYEVLWREE